MTPLEISQLLSSTFQDDSDLVSICDDAIWYIRADDTSRSPFVVYAVDSQVPHSSEYLSAAVSCNWDVSISVNVWSRQADQAEEIGRIITRIAHDMQTGEYEGIKYAEIEDRYSGIETSQSFPLYRFTVNIRIIV